MPKIDELVNRFLTWPVPADVYPDGTPGQPGRIGTNLLTAAQAKQMLEHVLGCALPQPRPLTDKQINRCISADKAFWHTAAKETGWSFGPNLHDFARAIERSHGIKFRKLPKCEPYLDGGKRECEAPLRARVAELEATEEGAKVAFGHVVEQKRAAEKECMRLQGLLAAAYADIRRLSRA